MERLPCKLGLGYIEGPHNAHSAAYWRRYGAHHMPSDLKKAGFVVVLARVSPEISLKKDPYFRLSYAYQQEKTYGY